MSTFVKIFTMKKTIFIFATIVLNTLIGKTQAIDSLTIYYFQNFPYAYNEGGKVKGIEIEIIEEYINWMKQKKNIALKVSYKPFTEFSSFYNAVKNGSPYVVGLGSITNTPEREKEVSFSPYYLQNVSVLITDGRIPTIKNKSAEEVSKVLNGLNALVVNKSNHTQYLNELKASYLPNLKISFTETQSKVLETIAADKASFGYVDIVAYWSFLKNNPSKFLKIQKLFSETKEYLSFAMPKNSGNQPYLSEFFESGFGFTSTKTYRQILEKYLGYEIIDAVEIK